LLGYCGFLVPWLKNTKGPGLVRRRHEDRGAENLS
jgi:hypothetical protein